MHRRGQLILLQLCADHRPIASWLTFCSGWTGYCYQTGFDPDYNHAGQLSIGYLVEHCIERGLRVIDYLRGAHGYKARWSDGFVETVHCAFPSRHPRGRLAFEAFRRYLGMRNGGR